MKRSYIMQLIIKDIYIDEENLYKLDNNLYDISTIYLVVDININNDNNLKLYFETSNSLDINNAISFDLQLNEYSEEELKKCMQDTQKKELIEFLKKNKKIDQLFKKYIEKNFITEYQNSFYDSNSEYRYRRKKGEKNDKH